MSDRLKYERFLWFRDRVKSGRYPNAARLAEEFEISPRTAQRDIEFFRYRGSDVKVISPPELKNLIKKEIEKMTKIYQDYDTV